MVAADSERNNSKSLPDLTDEETSTKLLHELKSATLLRANMAKSFSSRFVSHIKPDSSGGNSGSGSKVVRRKKSGLVDDHFQAIIPSCSDKKVAPVHEDSPPPCNCPRHFPKPSEVLLANTGDGGGGGQDGGSTSRHRLKTGDADILGKIDKVLNCRDIIALP